MILSVATGFALREWANMANAVPWSLLAGVVLARLAPGKKGCGFGGGGPPPAS